MRRALLLWAWAAAVPGSTAAGLEPWIGPPSMAPQYLGRRLEGPPARIVSVAPGVTELLFALGVGPRVVGVSRFDDQPPAVAQIPRVGGYLDPNPEAILAQKPDLVIAMPNASNRGVLERIAELGIPVLVVPGNTLADLSHSLSAIGRALGGQEVQKAKALDASIREELEAIASARGGGPPARVAVVYDRQPLVLAGPGSFAGALLRLLGAENVVKVGVDYPTYSREQLLLDAPEVIIDASQVHWLGTETATAALRRVRLASGDSLGGSWAEWSSLPAVREGRVFAVQGSALLRAGPRLVSALRELRAAITAPPLDPSPAARRR